MAIYVHPASRSAKAAAAPTAAPMMAPLLLLGDGTGGGGGGMGTGVLQQHALCSRCIAFLSKPEAQSVACVAWVLNLPLAVSSAMSGSLVWGNTDTNGV